MKQQEPQRPLVRLAHDCRGRDAAASEYKHPLALGGPMTRLVRVLPLFAVVILVFASGAAAQGSNATLQGTITDTGGGVLPGVAVKLTSPATGLQREAVTNDAGVYVFNFLPAGRYAVAAELQGFKSVRHDEVRLEVGGNVTLNMKMEVGR